jgi:hypothetical protein
VEVRTSTWEDVPSNPFRGYKTFFRLGVHFGIVIQILRAIYEEERAGESYDAVVFLKHDVLYPHDYFDRVAAAFEGNPKAPGVSNLDYIGLNHTGWVDVHTRHEPMHELSMRFGTAKDHFEAVLKKCVLEGAELLEPHDKSAFARLPFVGERPCCHINHTRHFTSHYNICESDSKALTVHPYWCRFRTYYPVEERALTGSRRGE